MKSIRIVACAAVAAAVTLAPSLHAQPTAGARAAAPVPYVTGGVGTDEQERMKALQQEGYNLSLVFAEQGTGAYLADVRVTVTDASGRTVLDATSDGPALVAKLPPGRYQVTADYRGMRQTRTINAGRAERVAFHWPAESGSAPQPAGVRAPHGDAPPLAPAHAGQGVGAGR
jgi:hypothetical protein